MSVQLIQRYHTELAQIKRVGRTINEEPLSRATERLLSHYARTHNLFFVAQPQRKTPTGHSIRPDGMIGDQFFDWGYWEAKDPKDSLDDEIREKLAKGYPANNILFENTETAVLYQAGEEVGRVQTKDLAEYDDLLNRFVKYQPPEIQKFREEIEQFKTVVPELAEQLRDIIEEQADSNTSFQQSAEQFLELCRKAINPAVVMADVREMLIQHILTQDIFNVIFDDPDFHRENAIAKKLGEVVDTFYNKRGEKQALTAKIRPFYEVIKARSAQIESHHEKQRFLKVLYETFYKAYNPKAADRLGIVYTPNEIVRFMVESADTLCYRHFQKSLSDDGVHILDPATGTGTYIVELLEYWEGLASRDPEQFKRKYENDLHCNEVSILPYYIANLNIEYTYQALTGSYEPFENIVFVDTLDRMNPNVAQKAFDLFAEENAARIDAQNKREISVIIGNPPYNAWQENYNKQNPNRPYKHVDQRIKDTYIKQGTAQNQIALYDMYVRFVRWASDRLGDEGIIAFVSNNSFVDSQSFDGFRKVIADEFDEMWVINLKGNARTSGERRRKEAGNIFDDAIRVGVAIYFLIRTSKKEGLRIYYNEIGDYVKSDGKRDHIASKLNNLEWQVIKPDKHHIWINQSNNDFDDLLQLISKDVKAGRSHNAIFHSFSSGIQTKRDEWMYDLSHTHLSKKVQFFAQVYALTLVNPQTERKMEIKWDADLQRFLERGIVKDFQESNVRKVAYRPFYKQSVYFDPHFNSRNFQFRHIFPKNDSQNLHISFNATCPIFSCLASDHIIDLAFLKFGNGRPKCAVVLA